MATWRSKPRSEDRGQAAFVSPFVKDDDDGGENQRKADVIVPLHPLLKIRQREDGEDHQGDDLLEDLELRRGVPFVVPDAVGGDLKHVLGEGDQPAHKDDQPEGGLLVIEVPVPRERHEHVGDRQEDDRFHRRTSYEPFHRRPRLARRVSTSGSASSITAAAGSGTLTALTAPPNGPPCPRNAESIRK